MEYSRRPTSASAARGPRPASARARAHGKAACVAALLLLGLGLPVLHFGCSEDETTKPNGHDDAFVIADSASVMLDVAAGAEIFDELTGLTLRFPAGAHGRLATGTLREAPARAWDDGSGYFLSYSGDEPCQLRVAHEEGGYEFLLGYGRPRGSQSSGAVERWFAMPVGDTLGAGDTRATAVWVAAGEVPGPSCDNTRYYWLIRFPAGSAEAQAFAASIATAGELLAAWRESWSEVFAQVDGARTPEELAPHFYPDGDYYSGFRRVCPGWGDVPAARIGLSPGAARATVAHQIGHYVTHLLIGDEAYFGLESRMSGEHGIGAVHPERTGLPEDYAHYFAFLLDGDIAGAGDPAVPAEFFPVAAPSPRVVDLPSVEGYGVLLMDALTRDQGRIAGLSGDTLEVPIVGLSRESLVTDLLALGAGDMNAFRELVRAHLETSGRADRLPVLAAATGWTPWGRSRVVGRTWAPLPGAEVFAVATAGGQEFRSAVRPTVSDGLGWFTLPAIFPGAQVLRVLAEADSFDFPLEADWDHQTHNGVFAADLFLWPDLSTLNRVAVILNLRFTIAPDDSVTDALFSVIGTLACDGSQGVFEEDRVRTLAPVSFAGGDPPHTWVLDSLTIAYSLSSGEVTDLLVRADRETPKSCDLEIRAAGPLRAEIPGSRNMYFGNLPGVAPEEIREYFTLRMTGPQGHVYTEEDLTADGQTLVIKATRS